MHPGRGRAERGTGPSCRSISAHDEHARAPATTARPRASPGRRARGDLERAARDVPGSRRCGTPSRPRARRSRGCGGRAAGRTPAAGAERGGALQRLRRRRRGRPARRPRRRRARARRVSGLVAAEARTKSTPQRARSSNGSSRTPRMASASPAATVGRSTSTESTIIVRVRTMFGRRRSASITRSRCADVVDLHAQHRVGLARDRDGAHDLGDASTLREHVARRGAVGAVDLGDRLEAEAELRRVDARRRSRGSRPSPRAGRRGA